MLEGKGAELRQNRSNLEHFQKLRFKVDLKPLKERKHDGQLTVAQTSGRGKNRKDKDEDEEE